MKKSILLGVLSMVAIFGGLYYHINAPMSTEEMLFDKIAYRNMLVKNAQGGVVTYGDKIEELNQEIKGLRQQLAVEDQARRNK